MRVSIPLRAAAALLLLGLTLPLASPSAAAPTDDEAALSGEELLQRILELRAELARLEQKLDPELAAELERRLRRAEMAAVDSPAAPLPPGASSVAGADAAPTPLSPDAAKAPNAVPAETVERTAQSRPAPESSGPADEADASASAAPEPVDGASAAQPGDPAAAEPQTGGASADPPAGSAPALPAPLPPPAGAAAAPPVADEPAGGAPTPEPGAADVAPSPAPPSGGRRACNSLAPLDSNDDGFITGADRYWRHLRLWLDDGDGRVEPRELESPFELGIRKISVRMRSYVTRKDRSGDVWIDELVRFDLFGIRDRNGYLMIDADALERGGEMRLLDRSGRELTGMQPIAAGSQLATRDGRRLALRCG